MHPEDHTNHSLSFCFFGIFFFITCFISLLSLSLNLAIASKVDSFLFSAFLTCYFAFKIFEYTAFTFKSIDKDFVIHSDHGFQYISKVYIDKINKMGGTVSLSRVGNSLDNREAKYWFSIIKSECLNEIDYSKITLEDLKKIIADYIFWYNNYRIQSILNWQTPQQYAMMSK
ncbi:IS3 family transposase [Mesomycoplasma ovipneumoniae]|uniref:IS3 family transposase n=1 Tax=Mesomycoplasma ovipneumoniae TaxID=29562 RepID=UPI00083E8161|nr:IS3 family transposase [Mesomycoplasma ovipneumoniae]